MEVIILLNREDIINAEWHGDVAAVIHSGKYAGELTGKSFEGVNTASAVASNAPQVIMRGRGMGREVLDLLRKRPEVQEAHLLGEKLTIALAGEVDVAPLVSLLVESGVELVEVRRHDTHLEELLFSLMQSGGRVDFLMKLHEDIPHEDIPHDEIVD